MLDYERLDVYQCALQFAGLVFPIIEALPRGHSQLADQLRRATLSIALNIAEGSGKTTDKERRRYHAIARGSAMECGAVLDILRIQNLDPPQVVQAKALLIRIVSMLSKMSRCVHDDEDAHEDAHAHDYGAKVSAPTGDPPGVPPQLEVQQGP